MRTFTLLTSLFFSQYLVASTGTEACYKDLSQNISRSRAAILCQGVVETAQQESVLSCYNKLGEKRIEKTRSAILCNKAFSRTAIDARISCYQREEGKVAYQRKAILCAGVESANETEELFSCYERLTKTIAKDRSAVLCSKSTIGAWILIKNLYN